MSQAVKAKRSVFCSKKDLRCLTQAYQTAPKNMERVNEPKIALRHLCLQNSLPISARERPAERGKPVCRLLGAAAFAILYYGQSSTVL
jgi:hypothetical protein